MPPVDFQHQEEIKEREAQFLLREDLKVAAVKIDASQYLIFGVFLFLLSGFWELQVHRPDYYSEAAQKNHIKALPIMAPRGKLLDRDGRVIVDNTPVFTAMLSRETLKEEHLPPIAEGLGLDLEELKQRLQRFEKRPKYEPVVIKEKLTQAELSFVESHRDSETFPELDLIESQIRQYPQDGVAAHVAGYVGEISDPELDTAEYARFKPGDVVGKSGIEKQYNDWLTGVDGKRQVVVNNRGREIRELGKQQAVPGKNLTLTIDLDLQVVGEIALEGKRGAVVALDPRNGEVLALASSPTYDANRFAERLQSEEWKAMLADPDKPMLNRAIQAQFAPGSTFKPIVALAALETHSIEDNFGVRCGGGATFYGRYTRCHKVHGGVQFRDAMALSCDVFFYTAGDRTGIDNIAKYAQTAGFGKKTGIDLGGETDGVLPSPSWKARVRRERWYAGETINVSIGQGALAVTPIQLAYTIGGMVVGGAWHKPRLTNDAGRGGDRIAPRRAVLQAENVARIIDGMYGAVHGGTASSARIPDVSMCGKTGTAQIVSNDFAKARGGGLRKDLRDNAWFVGFAPRENPEIVVAALFENGLHGSSAALIVRDVIKAHFEKKTRLRQDAKVLSMQQVLTRPR